MQTIRVQLQIAFDWCCWELGLRGSKETYFDVAACQRPAWSAFCALSKRTLVWLVVPTSALNEQSHFWWLDWPSHSHQQVNQVLPTAGLAAAAVMHSCRTLSFPNRHAAS